MTLKKAYLEQVLILSKRVKDHNRDVKKYDKNFTKYSALKKKSSKALIRKVYTEREIFLWGAK